MRRIFPLVTACFMAVLTTLTALPAAGGKPAFTVAAETMRSLPDGTLTAIGGVVVRSDGVELTAREMVYDPETHLLTLSGQVQMHDASGRSFTGRSLTLDVRDMTGGVREGEIRVGTTGVVIRGESIEKVGEDEYRTRRGIITSCSGDCPDWSFAASDIRVKQEGYLVAKNASFRIRDVPVFYTPYLVYPVMTRRQTGFLLPQFSFTEESGLESALPFYLTLGPHADATLTTRAFSRDATGFEGQLRYRLHYDGGGDWEGFSMADGGDRWFWAADHAGQLADGLWLRGRWADTGDPETPSRFGTDFEQRYPGPVSRQVTAEASYPSVRLWAGKSSLVTDAARAGLDTAGTVLGSSEAGAELGPLGLGGIEIGLRAATEVFEDGGGRRTMLSPWLNLQLPGPEPLQGRIWVQERRLIENDGSGSRSGTLGGIEERFTLSAQGDWGRHDIDFLLAYRRSQAARFGTGAPRDGDDAMEERSLVSGEARSRLGVGSLNWDLVTGFWRDFRLDVSRGYGESSLILGGFFLDATRNRDAVYGTVVPSLTTSVSSPRGWTAQVGYRSDDLSFSLGRETTEGSPDILMASGLVGFGSFRVSGEAAFDRAARAVSDESLSLLFKRECWNLDITRNRTRDRTDWKVKVELVI